MPFAPCPDCDATVLVDPSGRCPEGHHVDAARPRPAAEPPRASDATELLEIIAATEEVRRHDRGDADPTVEARHTEALFAPHARDVPTTPAPSVPSTPRAPEVRAVAPTTTTSATGAHGPAIDPSPTDEIAAVPTTSARPDRAPLDGDRDRDASLDGREDTRPVTTHPVVAVTGDLERRPTLDPSSFSARGPRRARRPRRVRGGPRR